MQNTTRPIRTIVCLVTQTLTKIQPRNAWREARMLKKGLLEFPNGTIFHPKYSCSRIAHFIPHQKAPSPKTEAINQFASRVDQFHFLWHVDLWQWFYGTNFFSIGSQISSHGVFDSILMHRNFNGWFLTSCKVDGSVFSVLSFNFFAHHYERSQPLLGQYWVTLVTLGYLHGLFHHFLEKLAPFFLHTFN